MRPYNPDPQWRKEAAERKKAANKKAAKNYAKKNRVNYTLKLNKKTEPELVQQMESQENAQGYLKGLIRDDIEREKKSESTS